MLINPREEDPLTLMVLDLKDTFYFLPSQPDGSKEYERAEHTIQLLKLNEADLLPAARREAFDNYYSRLHLYITRRDANAAVTELDHIQHALKRIHHPTVWHETKRQAIRLPVLKELFEQAPEAMDWEKASSGCLVSTSAAGSGPGTRRYIGDIAFAVRHLTAQTAASP